MTAAAREGGLARWHESRRVLSKFVGDLLAGELALLRHGGGQLPPQPWSDDLVVGEDGLGLDSLERMEVASALSEALHLHESGVEDLLLARRTFGEWIDVAARGLAHFDDRLDFRTSGSTGEPKRCRHALADLAQEVDHLAELVHGTKRIVSAVPSHHIYGFIFTVLLPQCLGGVEILDVRLLTPRGLTRQLRAGDLVVSHPAHWSLIASQGAPLTRGVTGVSSTAPCPPELAAQLSRPGDGLGRLLQVYGSSETAGVGWRDSPDAPFQLMPHWARAPGGQAGLLVRGGDEEQAISMQDAIEWSDDRRFKVTGRLDSAVQVGGINVFPKRIGEVISQHPEVREAVVRLMRPAEGNRLKAFVVPEDGVDSEALRVALDQYANQHLGALERPKWYTFGSRLPMDDRGKHCDWT